MNKRSFFRIICKRAYIAAIALSLASCSADDVTEPTTPPDGYIPVNIQLDDGYASSDTRSTLSSDDNITFQDGDALGLFVYAEGNSSPIQSNLKWIYDGSTWKPEDKKQQVKFEKNKLTIKAWYPYGTTALPAIKTDQMTVIYYEEAMKVLTGKIVQAEISKDPVSLTLKHPYALLKLSLESTSSASVSVVKLEVSDENNKKTYYSFHRTANDGWRLLYPAGTCEGTLQVTLSDGTFYKKANFSSTLTANQIYTYTLTLD
ncbi:fimbrillin family protein [Phocaeicola sp.]